MILPDLIKYREELKKEGVDYPLPKRLPEQGGLLKVLPAVEKTGWPWDEETSPTIYDKNKHWPKISIVTPSFNQGQFIEETIRSVLLQNYPNLEYIVIDGGSTDNSKIILEKYSPWISYWRSVKDEGQGQAINIGFSLASGAYYGWVNSDDYYLKDVLFMVAERFLKTRAEFIYGYGYSYHVKKNWFELVKVLPLLDFFIKIPSLVQPSTFWKSNIHQPIWEELHCSIDFELWIRMATGKKKSGIKKPLSVANVHELAKTSDPSLKPKWDEDEKNIWSVNGHGAVPYWNKINKINRIRLKIYKLLKLI